MNRKDPVAHRRRSAIARFFTELRRRHVFGSIAAYVLVAAFIIELSGSVFEALLLPDWSARLVTVLLILGLPVVAVLSWFFDISTKGIERTKHDGRVRERSPGELGAALQRSRSAPVPDAPVRRRRPVAGLPEPDGAAPDPTRVREAVLGHVRHELRTPINGIIGYSEMLLEDADDPALAADLERILTAGRRLLEQVDGVLRPERVPLEAMEDLHAFGEKVRVDLRTPISAVVGYAEMLKESCEEAGHDHLMEDLDRILRSARRLLELSDDIVRLATRTADGEEGLGDSSAMARQVLAKIRPMSHGSEAPEGEGRLLVVDDNETNRDLLSRQLARFGYTVATAVDGLEALDRLREQDYDLILLDVIMPRLDGVETLARLCSDDRLAAIPVIMLSSLSEMDSAVRCIEMGASDYLTKPIQPTLLEARIAAALEVRDLRGRETAYRRRVESDGVLIDRLLAGAFPVTLMDRIRDGALEIRESHASATAIRVVYPAALRPSSAPDGLERLQALQAVARSVEELAREHPIDALLWRTDGFVAVMFGGPGARGSGPGADADSPGAAALAGAPALAGAAAFALAARDRLADVCVGVHTGPVVAGVVGDTSPRFEVWGEAVESADALAAHAATGCVLVTSAVRSALGDAFETDGRGVTEVRDRGQMRVYSLLAAATEDARATAG